MVLRCSLLGHDYGDVDVEREREERGSEVVVTVREYEECARCGDKHVISENTEVRSISTAGAGPRPDEPEPQSTPRSAEPPAAEPNDAGTGGFTAETEATDATFIDADDAGSEPAPTQRPSAAGAENGGSGAGPPEGTAGAEPAETDTAETDFAETDATSFGSTGSNAPGADAVDAADAADAGLELPTDENGDPVTDDGEILEDDGTTTRDREYGEWPDSSDVGPPIERGTDDESDDWPDKESEPLEDDAILLDTGAELIEANSSDGDVETEPGTGPEPSESSSPAGGPPA
ncbi:hypothetical protein, partial [Natronococcus sp.]|uniref:DUF7093 family protein n=1 Tax=Natronococcus sp. TaxID=35747 RepID=UPI003A4E1DCD